MPALPTRRPRTRPNHLALHGKNHTPFTVRVCRTLWIAHLEVALSIARIQRAVADKAVAGAAIELFGRSGGDWRAGGKHRLNRRSTDFGCVSVRLVVRAPRGGTKIDRAVATEAIIRTNIIGTAAADGESSGGQGSSSQERDNGDRMHLDLLKQKNIVVE